MIHGGDGRPEDYSIFSESKFEKLRQMKMEKKSNLQSYEEHKLRYKIDKVSRMLESKGYRIESNGQLLTMKEYFEPTLQLFLNKNRPTCNDIRMFAQRFQDDSEEKYKKKLPKYGESWKTMTIKELQTRLKDEFEDFEFNKNKNWAIVYDKLIDIRNVASMLGKRISHERI